MVVVVTRLRYAPCDVDSGTRHTVGGAGEAGGRCFVHGGAAGKSRRWTHTGQVVVVAVGSGRGSRE